MLNFATKWEGMLPPLLNHIIKNSKSPTDADMMVLSTLTAVSACLPNVEGRYDRRVVYPNLFLFISAPASAGKGRLMMAKKIVQPIHRELRQAYQDELAQFKAEMETKGKTIDVDVKVPQTMLFLPANSSATALYQTLHDCGGSGLIFETEADTLATALKSDYGNFSDGLRKAFHHETISYNRRKEREYVEINNPRLSVLLAGTPRQIRHLIPDAENGLFSRFLMYRANIELEWLNVWDERDLSDDEYFDALGAEFYKLYQRLKGLNYKLYVSLTPQQKSLFNQKFEEWQRELTECYGISITPSVRRMGLIAYRLAMILSVLRLNPTSTIPASLTCSDTDFGFALDMVDVLIDHTVEIFEELPAIEESDATDELLPLEKMLLDALPESFNHKTLASVSLSFSISSRTAQRYVRQFIKLKKVTKIKHNQYEKCKI